MKIPHPLLGLALAIGGLGISLQETPPEPLASGDEAPALTLNDQEGNLVSIGGKSDDWVVLAFYPKALTGG